MNMNVERAIIIVVWMRIGAPFDFTGLNPISPRRLDYYL
jgi:hypothetical protein